eukprot:1177216-Prorocentrum_minimum.AAC.2
MCTYPPHVLEHDEPRDTEGGPQRDVEAPVAVDERQVVPIQWQAFRVRHEHGHLRAVSAGDEHLRTQYLVTHSRDEHLRTQYL